MFFFIIYSDITKSADSFDEFEALWVQMGEELEKEASSQPQVVTVTPNTSFRASFNRYGLNFWSFFIAATLTAIRFTRICKMVFYLYLLIKSKLINKKGIINKRVSPWSLYVHTHLKHFIKVLEGQSLPRVIVRTSLVSKSANRNDCELVYSMNM